MDRGVTPVVGVAVLLLLTVTLAASVGMVVTTATPTAPPTAHLTLAVETETQSIALTHEGGESLDVSTLDIHVTVNDTPLTAQPPIPFFAAEGFDSGPTGPFNSRSDDEWRAGETAEFRIAGTNEPQLSAESSVTVTVIAAETVIFEDTVYSGTVATVVIARGLF